MVYKKKVWNRNEDLRQQLVPTWDAIWNWTLKVVVWFDYGPLFLSYLLIAGTTQMTWSSLRFQIRRPPYANLEKCSWVNWIVSIVTWSHSTFCNGGFSKPQSGLFQTDDFCQRTAAADFNDTLLPVRFSFWRLPDVWNPAAPTTQNWPSWCRYCLQRSQRRRRCLRHQMSMRR